jgi:hypothetical protein
LVELDNRKPLRLVEIDSRNRKAETLHSDYNEDKEFFEIAIVELDNRDRRARQSQSQSFAVGRKS